MQTSPNRAERRARDVGWFVVREYPEGRHGDGGRPQPRSYGNAWAYVTGCVCLPLALVLAAIDPFGWPRWIYGALIFAAGLPGWNMVRSWGEDAKFPAYSVRGAAAQFWLYAGGALPQALRTIQEQRRAASDSSP